MLLRFFRLVPNRMGRNKFVIENAPNISLIAPAGRNIYSNRFSEHVALRRSAIFFRRQFAHFRAPGDSERGSSINMSLLRSENLSLELQVQRSSESFKKPIQFLRVW